MTIPKVSQMDVYPVAGYDSMLLNLSGAHGPFFTRNIVILTTNTGLVGVSEVPGGPAITETLEACRNLVVGQPIGNYKTILNQIKAQFGQLDAGGRGNQTFDLRTTIHVVTAVETALLDLLGHFLHVPVAALLGDGQQREQVGVLGYLFYVGDAQQTDLPYRIEDSSDDAWFQLRHRPALTSADIVHMAKVARAKYGFQTFKLKGGVLTGEQEVETMLALHQALPHAKLDLDPNGAWSLQEALTYAEQLKPVLHYIEDPCGAEDGFSGREILAEFQQRTHIPVATNMVDTDWRQMAHALALNAISIPLADPHFWTMAGSVRVAQLCAAFNLNWGIHSNNHFDISLAMAVNAAAAAPGAIFDIDTHWIWQDGQHLTVNPPQIKNGAITVPRTGEGLGVTVNLEAVKAANQLYRQHHLGQRDDALAMQQLRPGWQFDPHKPAMTH